MKKLILLGCLSSVFACTPKQKEVVTPVVCDVVFKATTAASQGIANALGCSNVPAISADLSKSVLSLNLCTTNTTSGLIGDMVCGQVASVVLGIGLNTLPKEWGCTGGNLGNTAKQFITDKCKASVPY